MEELTPITRREVFLAKASGQNEETPTPVTREEVFLYEIAKRGGGSSGGGVLVVNCTVYNAKSGETKDGATRLICDKTAGEISAAMLNGIVYFKQETKGESIIMSICTGYALDDLGYSFASSDGMYFYADTENDYPISE